ncbi:MAG: DUF6320 domain-containing protein [Sporolactobacillus sp.]|uniref:DUF6320 domain-containing protein n=1 Tax=Sporolactobacillus sp. STSJ-5 TaxID=2965076 RepID=UPI00210558F3|nr:DUF6320 domain-containing protein [Sporolactobacillus sp. STSJ-5]MCQ2008397.1 DUF6320 domain-containing protein [Sporolactobacillus sp. STSJ-5]
MKYCGKCKVSIRGKDANCPLCQSRLSGTDEEELYPFVPTIYRQYELFFKLLIFVTIMIGVLCVAVNLILPDSGFWSLFVAVGIGCFWISLIYALQKKDNIPNNITAQVFILSALSLGWDWFTSWRGWSLNYVIPIACSVAMISLAIIAKVTKMPAEDYIVYFIIDIVFGIVPLILYFTGQVGFIIPSVICISLSVLSLSALILFEGKNVLQEIAKNFHV